MFAYFVLFFLNCVLSLDCTGLVVSTSGNDCLDKLFVPQVTCNHGCSLIWKSGARAWGLGREGARAANGYLGEPPAHWSPVVKPLPLVKESEEKPL